MMLHEIDCCRPCSDAVAGQHVTRFIGISRPVTSSTVFAQYHPDPRTDTCCHVRNIKTIPILPKNEGGMAFCVFMVTIGIDSDIQGLAFALEGSSFQPKLPYRALAEFIIVPLVPLGRL
jgi:hypothetical protein